MTPTFESEDGGVRVCEWHGCYDKPLKGFIVPEAFSHPAKFSLALIERIYDHCLERGYLKRGDRVGDPFGGVATGGIVAAYRGLEWVGVELEERFCKLAQENIDRHALRLTRLGCPWPVIKQGDSRRFAEVVAGVVTSPPYAETVLSGGGGIANEMRNTYDKDENYGAQDGQIGRLKSGSVEAVVSSPPYVDSIDRKSGIDPEKVKRPGGPNGNTFHDTYGQADGQIGRLSAGSIDAAVTSPPWEDGKEGVMKASKFKDPKAFAEVQRHKGHYASAGAKLACMVRDEQRSDYGSTAGQIGNSKGETYWEAVSAVYRSCFQAIRPGGVICLVVKDYIKAGKRVPLCDDTARLLEHIGFTPLERIHAMLVKERRHLDLFQGESVDTKSRKSFFRRLAEKKGSPPIDYEEVLIFRRPG